MSDYQKSRLYAWENQYIAPLDRGNVPFEQIQQIVDYVWFDMGMEHPPQICTMAKHNHSCVADATRMKIRVRASGCPTWVILHELAHSMTSDFEGRSHGHGKRFVEAYLNLVCRYLANANKLLLVASLRANKIEF